jgi:hypothetical protein
MSHFRVTRLDIALSVSPSTGRLLMETPPFDEDPSVASVRTPGALETSAAVFFRSMFRL